MGLPQGHRVWVIDYNPNPGLMMSECLWGTLPSAGAAPLGISLCTPEGKDWKASLGSACLLCQTAQICSAEDICFPIVPP